MNEEWRQVVGYSAYEVSNFGNVRRIGGQHIPRNGRLRRPRVGKNGYVSIALWAGTPDGKAHHRLVHRLVAAAFIGEANGRDVNHIDANRTNNWVGNLEYLTRRENVYHCMALGRHAKGTRINGCTLDEQKVRVIRERLALGVPQLHIANSLGVSKSAVHLVAKGKTWRWLST